MGSMTARANFQDRLASRSDAFVNALEENRRLQLLIIAAITLLALGLRLYRLGDWSLWGDEMITIDRVGDLAGLSLVRQSLSLLLTGLTISAFGTAEWSARLASAILGTLTVPVLYALVRKVYGGAAAALAALFLAISPWHLYWSQNARFYTSLLLWYTLALFSFYFGLEEDRPRYLIASLVCLGLAALERPTAVFLIPIILAYLLLLRLLPFERPRGLNLRNLAVFFLPGVIPGAYMLYSFPAVRDPSKWLGLFGFINNSPIWILAGVVYYVGIPAVCLGLAAGALLLVRKDRGGLYFLIAALVPFIGVLVLSFVQYTANRYVFVALTAWVILAAVGAREVLYASLRGAPRLLGWAVLLILLATPVSGDILYFRYQNGNRDNWKAAFAYVADHARPGDKLVSSNRQLAVYYLGRDSLGMVGFDPESLVGSGERVWFVLDFNVDQKWPEVRRWVRYNAHLVAEFDVHVEARNFDMDVYLYDPAGTASVPPD